MAQGPTGGRAQLPSPWFHTLSQSEEALVTEGLPVQGTVGTKAQRGPGTAGSQSVLPPWLERPGQAVGSLSFLSSREDLGGRPAHPALGQAWSRGQALVVLRWKGPTFSDDECSQDAPSGNVLRTRIL